MTVSSPSISEPASVRACYADPGSACMSPDRCSPRETLSPRRHPKRTPGTEREPLHRPLGDGRDLLPVARVLLSHVGSSRGERPRSPSCLHPQVGRLLRYDPTERLEAVYRREEGVFDRTTRTRFLHQFHRAVRVDNVERWGPATTPRITTPAFTGPDARTSPRGSSSPCSRRPVSNGTVPSELGSSPDGDVSTTGSSRSSRT